MHDAELTTARTTRGAIQACEGAREAKALCQKRGLRLLRCIFLFFKLEDGVLFKFSFFLRGPLETCVPPASTLFIGLYKALLQLHESVLSLVQPTARLCPVAASV